MTLILYAGPEVFFVTSGRMSGGDVLNIIFAIIIGAFSLVGLGPALQTINKGRGVCSKLFDVIEQVPNVLSDDTTGVIPEKCTGKIEFQNVSFEYPSRPGVTVLSKFSLTVEPGKTVALVGFGGSGKSVRLTS